MENGIAGNVVPIDDLELPETLYKYRNFNDPYHLKSIYERAIYVPSANQFNDPFDAKIPFRYRDEDLTVEKIHEKCLQIARLSTKQTLTDSEYHTIAYNIEKQDSLKDPHHLEQVDKLTYQRLCNDYGIFCVTPDATNLLMWSYYGDSHKGFCIGYNSQYLVKCGLFGMGGQIAYRKDFPKLPLFLTEDDHPMLNILFSKWDKWEHENEYRLIHRYKMGKEHILEAEAITEIVLGSMLSDKEKFDYAQELTQKLPHVKIYQIELNKKTFGLNKVPVFDPKLFI